MDPKRVSAEEAAKHINIGTPLPTNVIEVMSNGLIIHRPESASFINDQWYALADKLGLDADAFQVRCYISGWYAIEDRPELSFIDRPTEVVGFEGEWIGTKHDWYITPDIKHDCQWSAELIPDTFPATFVCDRAWPQLRRKSNLPEGQTADTQVWDGDLMTLAPSALTTMPRAEIAKVAKALGIEQMAMYMDDNLLIVTVGNALTVRQMTPRTRR